MPVFLLRIALERYLYEFHIHGRRFEVNGFTLDPMNMVEHGGSILAAYVNSQGTHAVLFPPQINCFYVVGIK